MQNNMHLMICNTNPAVKQLQKQTLYAKSGLTIGQCSGRPWCSCWYMLLPNNTKVAKDVTHHCKAVITVL